ncbi:peptide deformylase [Paraburkholderia sp. BL6669N2]|nr:peptide deformylase [Paraburkholderia sp. BL6669N2]
MLKFSSSEITAAPRPPARARRLAPWRVEPNRFDTIYPLRNATCSQPGRKANEPSTGRRRAKITLKIMALLNILNYPDKRLHKVAKPVEVVNDRIRRLVKDMAETMYAAPGVGLAATQVDVHERVITIDVSDDHNELLAFINPEIIWSSDERKLSEEGCLSVPGIYDNVERAEKVRVRALNEKGETFEMDCEGLLAVCIQHEMDHLMGRVFVEYLSSLKQTRIKSKMKKLAHAM